MVCGCSSLLFVVVCCVLCVWLFDVCWSPFVVVLLCCCSLVFVGRYRLLLYGVSCCLCLLLVACWLLFGVCSCLLMLYVVCCCVLGLVCSSL